nr:hypothetical protein [Kibdelosporangium sp. MJ126-NF4]
MEPRPTTVTGLCAGHRHRGHTASSRGTVAALGNMADCDRR